jgi:hypothetical protein
MTFGLLAVWVMGVSTVALGATLAGLDLHWRDGARLCSLAGMPLLLKMAGAAVFSLATTLSPFHFQTGLGLFSPSALLKRVDVVEFWALALLAYWLSRWPGSSRLRAGIIVGLFWCIVMLVTVVFSRLGGRT